MQYPIIINNITKRYGAVSALKGVSFEVGKGELFGLIGPDGAGKTTLFRLLTTLLKPDEGSAQVEGTLFLLNPLTLIALMDCI